MSVLRNKYDKFYKGFFFYVLMEALELRSFKYKLSS